MSPVMSAGSVRPAEGVTARRLGDGGVLVNLRDSQIYEFNATGMAIWELLCIGLPHAEMVSALVEEFDVSPDLARAALAEHVSNLLAQGLVDQCSSS